MRLHSRSKLLKIFLSLLDFTLFPPSVSGGDIKKKLTYYKKLSQNHHVKRCPFDNFLYSLQLFSRVVRSLYEFRLDMKSYHMKGTYILIWLLMSYTAIMN